MCDYLIPVAGGYPEHFLLHYSLVELENTTETVMLLSPNLTLTGLQPLTQYRVNVASYNTNGLSDFSQDVLFGTFGRWQ